MLLYLHKKELYIKDEYIAELDQYQVGLNGDQLEGKVWYKWKFNIVIDILDDLGLDYELMGSFTTGVYIETKGWKPDPAISRAAQVATVRNNSRMG